MPTRRSSTTSARPTPCSPATSFSCSSSSTGPSGTASTLTGLPSSNPIVTTTGSSGASSGFFVMTKMCSGASCDGSSRMPPSCEQCHRLRSVEYGFSAVARTGAQRGEDEIAHECFAQVFDDAVFGARPLGFRDQPVELGEALPHIGGKAHDARAVLLAQPGNDGRGIEPTRIGEHHERAGLAVVLFMHRCE